MQLGYPKTRVTRPFSNRKPGFVCGEKPGFYGFNLTLKCNQNYEEIKVN